MKTKRKNATATVVAASKPGHYNQQKMINLWEQGKSVAEIAKAEGCSDVYARRVLSTKAPAQYKAGLEARHTASGAAPAKANGNGKAGNGNGHLSTEAAVKLIARSVAGAVFSDAQLVPAPTTRTEMFNNITKGVKAAVRQIGFHA